MKEAKIKCPCCGASITVRQKDGSEIPVDIFSEAKESADEMFKAVDQGFKKVFDPKNWKW